MSLQAHGFDFDEFTRDWLWRGASEPNWTATHLTRDMMERRQIVKLWRSGGAGALVTLVRVEGSSYRRPGARLLVGFGAVAGGASHAGTISGGCLEADVIRRAHWLARGEAQVERYSTSFDDTAEIPFGLGCGGTVELLFEPAAAPEGAALLEAMAASLEGRVSTVVSFLPDERRSLRRVVYDADGGVTFASEGLPAQKVECARELQVDVDYDGRFVERLEAPQRLFVFGAGEDAKPLVVMAAMLGWSAIVGDGRAQLASTDRFPQAANVCVLREGTLRQLGIGERDAVILMTHSYEQDRELLAGVLPLRPRYLGLLGSRHRSSLLVAEAAAMLSRSVEACCGAIFAPVGMNLGGDGPEAIALAIVAEVQAVTNGRAGVCSPRRLKVEEITANIEQGGASRYLQAQCGLDVAAELR